MILSQTRPPPDGGGGPNVPNGIEYGGVIPVPLLGRIATTVVPGTVEYPQLQSLIPIGSDIFGPFEAGFSTERQGNILSDLGCSVPVDVPGGIDTHTAEQMIAYVCNVTLPRFENGQRKSLLDSCGGHTQYHLHERLKCLYNFEGSHSPQIGVSTSRQQGIYGKWEDYNSQRLPQLDWCGGHFGPVPGEVGQPYHYHMQDVPPFTLACEGPSTGNSLVTRSVCRSVYSEACDGVIEQYVLPNNKSVLNDQWCPCFDGNGSNTGDSPRITDLLTPPPPSFLPPSPQPSPPFASPLPNPPPSPPPSSHPPPPPTFPLFDVRALLTNVSCAELRDVYHEKKCCG